MMKETLFGESEGIFWLFRFPLEENSEAKKNVYMLP